MKIVRSWPASPPPGRPHVIDSLPRLVMADYDYTPLGELAGDDEGVIVLEWDIAVGLGDLHRFAVMAQLAPSAVHVAPYPLYHIGMTPVQAHRRKTGPGLTDERWIRTNEPTCDLFGLGMVYLPCQLIREFLSSDPTGRTDRRFTDQTFSMWHYTTGRGPVTVDWSVRPVHLHY